MRRPRRLAFTAVALLLATGAAIGIDELMWRGAHAAAVASVVADAVRDPGSIFADRSPGERGDGLLLQTKPERVALAPGLLPPGPEERVLANVRERPPETELALAGPAFALGDMPGPDMGAPGIFPPSQSFPSPLAGGRIVPPLLAGPLTPPTSQSFPPGGGPPGGGPPGGGPPSDNPPSDQPPGGGLPPGTPTLPPTPVPEPAAWTLMILAIFGVGAALRWRRAGHRITHGGSTGFNA
jgi:hypothetical protein